MFQVCLETFFKRSLKNDLRSYADRSLSVKPLSSTWNTSVFITICSLEIVQFVANLGMITALSSGLSHAFRSVVEENKYVIHQPRSVRIGKTMPAVLSIRDLVCLMKREFVAIRKKRVLSNKKCEVAQDILWRIVGLCAYFLFNSCFQCIHFVHSSVSCVS